MMYGGPYHELLSNNVYIGNYQHYLQNIGEQLHGWKCQASKLRKKEDTETRAEKDQIFADKCYVLDMIIWTCVFNNNIQL